jgi:hypothetical protein
MKTRSSRTPLGAFLALALLSATAVAFEDIPLTDWTVPKYSLDGVGKAVDATPPRAFIGLTPCRVIDTRGGAPLGGGILSNSEARDFDVDGICGIPPGAEAISANFTVTGSPSAPPGAFILAYPTGSPPSPIVSLLNFQAGQTIANAGIVPLNGSGSLTINVSHSTHVIMDVNGYFADEPGSPGNPFEIHTISLTRAISASNSSPGCTGACGIRADINSTGGAHAISGYANGTSGVNYGVYGQISSTEPDAAGVIGIEGSGSPGLYLAAGVRGASAGQIGVLGFAGAGGLGVAGSLRNAAGTFLRGGILGWGSYGIYAEGNYGGTGAKYFVEPHPERADMVIRYVSLEGPESGTYFRGRAKFVRGVAEIAVPDSFRMVTDAEGLSIQVTAIGEMATVAVSSIGLEKIVVKGSRNVEFFYTVNGVRKTHKHLTPIGPGQEFMPKSADATMPLYLTDGQKAMLISNGTYKEDGTVNMETARRLGWDEVWKARSASKKTERSE